MIRLTSFQTSRAGVTSIGLGGDLSEMLAVVAGVFPSVPTDLILRWSRDGSRTTQDDFGKWWALWNCLEGELYDDQYVKCYTATSGRQVTVNHWIDETEKGMESRYSVEVFFPKGSYSAAAQILRGLPKLGYLHPASALIRRLETMEGAIEMIRSSVEVEANSVIASYSDRVAPIMPPVAAVASGA